MGASAKGSGRQDGRELMTRRRLSDAERRVWRQVARTVKPLDSRPEPDRPPPDEDFGALLDGRRHMDAPHVGKRAQTQLKTAPSQRLVPAEKPDKPSSGAPANAANDKRVRRGRFDIEGRLDLHGHTQDSARAALAGFVAFHRGAGARCVLVITGKGRTGEGVIRRRFLSWIGEPSVSRHVSSYSQAHQKHGGSGAFYLFLRRR